MSYGGTSGSQLPLRTLKESKMYFYWGWNQSPKYFCFSTELPSRIIASDNNNDSLPLSKLYLNFELINQTKFLCLKNLQTTALNRWGKPVKTTVTVTGVKFLQSGAAKDFPKELPLKEKKEDNVHCSLSNSNQPIAGSTLWLKISFSLHIVSLSLPTQASFPQTCYPSYIPFSNWLCVILRDT